MFLSNKKIILVIIIVTIISGLVTWKLIENENSKLTIEEAGNNSISSDYERTEAPGIDLAVLQKSNPINFETIKDEIDGKELYYYKIDGLKNEAVEKRINKKIKDMAYKMYREDIGGSCYVEANYGNVLSINCGPMGINVELINGNDINFLDLFTKNADIYNIIASSIYKTEVNRIMRDAWCKYDISKIVPGEPVGQTCSKKPDGFDDSTIDFSDLENIVYRKVEKIKNTKNIQYSFNNVSIYIHDLELGYGHSIQMYPYYKDIAIYNRYQTTEVIYDGKYSQYNILPLLPRQIKQDNFLSNKLEYLDDKTLVEVIVTKYCFYENVCDYNWDYYKNFSDNKFDDIISTYRKQYPNKLIILTASGYYNERSSDCTSAWQGANLEKCLRRQEIIGSNNYIEENIKGNIFIMDKDYYKTFNYSALDKARNTNGIEEWTGVNYFKYGNELKDNNIIIKEIAIENDYTTDNKLI